jgi:alpha-galactosidase
MRTTFLHALALICAALTLPASAAIRYDPAQHLWSLTSGGIEYRIGQRQGDAEAISLLYFGPEGGKTWPACKQAYTSAVRNDIGGMINGQQIRPEFLTLQSSTILTNSPQFQQLRLVYKHKFTSLEVEVLYTAYAETGVFTKDVTFTNTGSRPLQMEAAPSLDWRLPPGQYDLNYLHGERTHERQLTNVTLGAERQAFVNQTGRSSNGYSPWFDLLDHTTGIQYAAQLAYSGNWQMYFQRALAGGPAQEDLRVSLGMRFDFGGAAPLQPGAAFQLPRISFTASAGDLNDVVNQLHHYQRQFVFPQNSQNRPPLVTESLQEVVTKRAPTAPEVKHYADLVAPLGVEAIIIDAGWFMHQHTQDAAFDKDNPIYGDWNADPGAFPKGLRDVSDYVHSKGMKFGVWVELECATIDSPVVKAHPDWILRYDGTPIPGTRNRVYLDFRKPEVRAWARPVIDRLVKQDGVDWLKMDYNVDIGENFDPADASQRTGTLLHDDLAAYFAMLDQVRRDYPKLIIEDCSSGGARLDLEIMSRMDTPTFPTTSRPKAKRSLNTVAPSSSLLRFAITGSLITKARRPTLPPPRRSGSRPSSVSPCWVSSACLPA